MITRENIIRPRDLLTLAKKSPGNGSSCRVPLFAQFRRAPDKPLVAGRAAIVLLHNANPARQAVVGKLTHMSSIRNPYQAVYRVPGILICRRRCDGSYEVSIEVVSKRFG